MVAVLVAVAMAPKVRPEGVAQVEQPVAAQPTPQELLVTAETVAMAVLVVQVPDLLADPVDNQKVLQELHLAVAVTVVAIPTEELVPQAEFSSRSTVGSIFLLDQPLLHRLLHVRRMVQAPSTTTTRTRPTLLTLPDQRLAQVA
jgi:hypothetical protein